MKITKFTIPILLILFSPLTYGDNMIISDVTDDSYVSIMFPENNYNNYIFFNLGSGLTNYMMPIVRFNLSSLPSNIEIVNASVYLYANISYIETGESFLGTVHHVYPEYNWTEETIVYANCPSNSSQMNMSYESSYNFTISTASMWIHFDVTKMLYKTYHDNSNNISIFFNLTQTNIGTTDYINFPSKEDPNIIYTEYLNITYNPLPNTKGLINTTPGAVPFYTNDSNPRTITLLKDESQLVVFWVNATGNALTNYTFFGYANKSSDMLISNQTINWNVTILSIPEPSAIKSGLINQTVGAIPFYTNDSNPRTITLLKDESQLVVFWVNATGDLNTTHLFYAYANRTANMSQSNLSLSWNVTISETILPPVETDCEILQGNNGYLIDGSTLIIDIYCNVEAMLQIIDGEIIVTSSGNLIAIGCYIADTELLYVEDGGGFYCG